MKVNFSHRLFGITDETNFEEAAKFNLYDFFEERGLTDNIQIGTPDLILAQELENQFVLPKIEYISMLGLLQISMSSTIEEVTNTSLMYRLKIDESELESYSTTKLDRRILQDVEIP